MNRPIPREVRTCQTCGQSFLFLPSPSKLAAGRGKYCSKSCGVKKTSVRHGHCGGDSEPNSPTYVSYYAMLARCHNPKNAKFHVYGGIGIAVCGRWRESFPNFLADMGERPPGMSLDRYPDQGGNYEPSNCRWATPKEQQHNLKNNRNITFCGRTQCISAWAQETGLRHCVISYRLNRGWPIDLALGTPARLGNRIAS